jgi:hypothetical protein
VASPFRSAANLKLFIPAVSGREAIGRDALGNQIATPQSKIMILCYAYRVKTKPSFQHEIGIDESTITLACRCVKPFYLPSNVQPQLICEGIFNNRDGSITNGRVTIMEMAQSPWKPVAKALGTSFKILFAATGRDATRMESAKVEQALS